MSDQKFSPNGSRPQNVTTEPFTPARPALTLSEDLSQGGTMSAQHIAGFPVEEILLAATAAAAPLVALIGWEIRDRVRRLRSLVRRPNNAPATRLPNKYQPPVA